MNLNFGSRMMTFTAALAITAGGCLFLYNPNGASAQDNLTPGMLFGPLFVTQDQRIELCAANLGEGDIKAVIHFRNTTTGEVTANEELTLKQGGGACAYYMGLGRVVGMARGDGRASDWVSPSNALISTMSVIDNKGRALSVVLGNAKLWLRGL